MKWNAYFLTLHLLLATCSTSLLQAGAWAQKKGEGMSLLTYRFYSTDQEFLPDGHLRDFSDNGEFRKHELNLYVEYGLLPHLTGTGNFFLNQVEFENTRGADANLGLPNQELGLRWQFCDSIPQSLQFTASLPGLYAETTTPILANNQYDFELLYFIGGNHKIGKLGGFWEAGLGPKFRTESPSDQLRWFVTGGLKLSPTWDWTMQLEGTHGIGNDQPQVIGNNVTVTTDYTLLKASPTLTWHVNEQWFISAGPFFHFHGKTTGAGEGGQVSVGIKF